jgi:RNA polymerase sigma factor (sigma-70 family)
MEYPPKFRILDDTGQPLSPHIEQALLALVPKFQRQFPGFRDELSLVEILEEAGRKIDRREKRSGPIERLHAYAWVALRSVATSRLRRGEGRLAQRTLPSEEGEAVLDSTPARAGGPDEIERRILLRQVLETLTPDERLVCIWRKAGFSNQEIADRRGGTAHAVDMVLLRVKQKVRKLLGVSPGAVRQESRVTTPRSDAVDEVPGGKTDVENRDDK